MWLLRLYWTAFHLISQIHAVNKKLKPNQTYLQERTFIFSFLLLIYCQFVFINSLNINWNYVPSVIQNTKEN